MSEKWWKEAVVYQIYPRSFCDSNGDGIGDIQGIISKLDYLKQLGINVIWLSPVYKSPNEDNGYDISDYYSVNEELGTLEEMKNLFYEAKIRGIKIIMDLVINHVSNQHEWFIKGQNVDSEYHDYFIWRKGKDGGKRPPNNWTSFFTGSAWEKNDLNSKYFLHLFSNTMPDLNFHNPKVIAEVKAIMKFWLDMGISGFRCDVINVIFKSSLKDGKKRIALTGQEYYVSQYGCHKILKELKRDVTANYDCFLVGETVLVNTDMANDLCADNRQELDMVFGFEHMETEQISNKWFKLKFQPEKLFRVITKWQTEVDWNANYLENHDQPRSVSRFGDDKNFRELSAKMLCTMLLTLRGTPYIFEGQEIGMTNGDFLDIEEMKDLESHNVYNLAKELHFPKKLRWSLIKKTSRDNARTPMQWSKNANASFTTGKPWLQINKNFENINVEQNLNDKDSVLNFYKELISIRKNTETLLFGTFKRLNSPKNVFIFERKLKGEKYLTICNFSNKKIKIKFKLNWNIIISNYKRTDLKEVNFLEPYESILIKINKS